MMASPVNRMVRIYALVVSAFFTMIGTQVDLAWIKPLRAATTELIVVNRHTGLAISGFDPVAYFTKASALPGRVDLEARFGGATWRFVNAGNRAAFVDDPNIYMPGFGGYDPTSMARGVAVPGHPEIWLIVGDRLYLFRDDEARAAFAAAPEQFAAAAQNRWPEVQKDLVH
jgi:hypothetical protein